MKKFLIGAGALVLAGAAVGVYLYKKAESFDLDDDMNDDMDDDFDLEFQDEDLDSKSEQKDTIETEDVSSPKDE